jgi:hypothetical protein
MDRHKLKHYGQNAVRLFLRFARAPADGKIVALRELHKKGPSFATGTKSREKPP